MRKVFLFLMGLFFVFVTNAQLKETIKKTYGNSDFYNVMSESEKMVFYGTLKKLNIDTFSYKIITTLDEYFQHTKYDSVGGRITSSSFTKFNKKEIFTTYSRNKKGIPISTPILYITYWKDSEDDFFDLLVMTKN